MSHFITREKAILEIEKNRNEGECLICSLINGKANFILEKNDRITVFLSEYPRFKGQIMIAPTLHVEQFSRMNEEVWKEMNGFALKSARILEKLFLPARCYIASTGSPENLPMTCPHIHINVIPVYDRTLQPAQVFTWAHGVYAGSGEEWNGLFSEIKNEWSH